MHEMLTIGQLQEAAQRTAHEVRELHNVSAHTVGLLQAAGDHPTAERLMAAAQHGTTEELSLVFAGEHKSGKSSLINGLLGARIVNTSPLGTTATTVEMRRGRNDARFVVLADDDEMVKVEIDTDLFLELQTSTDPFFDGRPVSWLEAEIDHPLLNAGLVLVDTPSISGGMQSRAAGAVLGRLSFSHALIFVTDASQELTGPELEFIEIAATLCPQQLVVTTKTDLYPEWHRLVSINDTHLANSNLERTPTVLPTAVPLRWASIRLNDADLDRESGIPLLTWYVGVTVLTEARLAALRVAADLTESAAAAMVTGAEERRDTLAGTTEQHQLEVRLEGLHARFAALSEERQHGFELHDSLAAFSSAVESDLQWRMTAARAATRDRLQELDGPEQWSGFEAELNATWNELFARHLAFVPEAIEHTFAQLREQLELELAEIEVRSLGDSSVRGELDRPGRPRSFADMSLRIGIGGGASAGAGAANIAGLLGVGVVMSAGLAVIGGGVAGVGAFLVSRALGMSRSRDQWRSLAEREVNEYHESVGGSIQAHSKKIQLEVPIRIRREFAKAIDDEGSRTRAEIDRLERMLQEARGRTDEAMGAAEDELAHARLVHSHARRLVFRLRQPLLAKRHSNTLEIHHAR